MQPTDDATLPWHTMSVADVAQRLVTDPVTGLGAAEVARRRARFGPNAVMVVKRRSPFAILWHQFRSLVVALLGLAATIALVMGESFEAGAILMVVVLNAVIGFVTEWNAERALHSLRSLAVPFARVIRDAASSEVPATDLVPGDLVALAAGGRVPADGRLVEAERLHLDESTLTGESLPVSKEIEAIADLTAGVADRTNMVYMGTAVADGRATFLVTATGMRTELGLIGKLVADVEIRRTPIEQRIAQLGRVLLVAVAALAVVIVFAGWLRGHELLGMLEVGVSLAIAAVPEGLPAVTTMTLAIGARRMARLNALIRRLPAVETLGSTTIICTDKTGTLTRNEMTARVFHVGDRRVEVGGSGYACEGDFRVGGERIEPEGDIASALRIGMLCNDASIDRRHSPPRIAGDPTEAALIVAAEKAGLQLSLLQQAYPRTAEVPFSSESKRMVTVHRRPEGGFVAYAKGSPGTLLAASASQLRNRVVVALGEGDREHWESVNRELAGKGLRVLGLAWRDLSQGWRAEDLTHDFVYVGLVGLVDPIRDEARETIAVCQRAGIRTIMLTGDQPVTAVAIAQQLGIDRNAAGHAMRAVHGRELGSRNDAALEDVVASHSVFARVSPRDKLRIVEALQRGGHVVAVTGDGVNDGPALRQANIGVAMGIKGTEVAKDAADMIITDDNFATIVAAVEQGRSIVRNIQRFIQYLFSCNVAEILTVLGAIAIGWPLPLTALQILWLNMITDVFPALALALEPAAPDTMRRPPRNASEPLLTRAFGALITWQGAVIVIVTLGAYFVAMRRYGIVADGPMRAGTIAFMTLALAQVFHAFNVRSRKGSTVTRELFTNRWLWAALVLCVAMQLGAVYVPVLNTALSTVRPWPRDWALIGVAAFMPVLIVEMVKAVQRGRARAQANASSRPLIDGPSGAFPK